MFNSRKQGLLALLLATCGALIAEPQAKTPPHRSSLRDACDYLYAYVFTPAVLMLPILTRKDHALLDMPMYTAMNEEIAAEIVDIATEMGMNPGAIMIRTLGNTKRTDPDQKQKLVSQDPEETPDCVAHALGGILCISEKLYDALSPQERRALIGHELSHIKNRDMLVATIAATLATTISYMGNMIQIDQMKR